MTHLGTLPAKQPRDIFCPSTQKQLHPHHNSRALGVIETRTANMPGTLSLRAATASDAQAMGLIGTRSFRDSLSTVIFPAHLRTPATEDAETPWRAARTLRRMKEGKDTFVVIDSNDSGEETVVGFAQWERPGGVTKGQEGQYDEDKVTDTLDGEALAKLLGDMDVEAKKQLGPEGYGNMWCK